MKIISAAPGCFVTSFWGVLCSSVASAFCYGYTRFRAAVPSQHWRERWLRTPQWWNGLPGQRSQAIDNVKSKLDLNGTESKMNLGANAILGVCIACRAGAGRMRHLVVQAAQWVGRQVTHVHACTMLQCHQRGGACGKLLCRSHEVGIWNLGIIWNILELYYRMNMIDVGTWGGKCESYMDFVNKDKLTLPTRTL